MQIAYGDVLGGSGCIITPGTDIDLFRFSGRAADVIRIVAKRIGGTAGSVCGELYGPDQGLLQLQCGSLMQINATLLATGTHTLVIRESISLAINYGLSLSYIFSDQVPYVFFNTSISDQINPGHDVDLLRFSGTQNDSVRVVGQRVGGTAGGVCIQLYGPDHGLIQVKCGSLIQIDATLTATGTHTLVIWEGLGLAISYSLGLHCLFGVCAPPAFTDDPLVSTETPIKAIHVTELRSRIDGLRLRSSLVAPFNWTTRRIVSMSSEVLAVDLTELRTALNQVFDARGVPKPTYTDAIIIPKQTSIKTSHFTELRAAVLLLEAASP